MIIRNFIIFCIGFFILGNSHLDSQDLVPIPKLNSPVMDLSGILSPGERAEMESQIRNLQKETGAQVQVLVLDSVSPESIEQFSIRLGDTWKLGRSKVDDGVILLVALKDRQVRIEVGYGLEGAIPDAIANRIIQNSMVPKFQEGKFGSGIRSGLDDIEKLIRGEALPAPTGEVRNTTGGGKTLSPVELVLGGVGLLLGFILKIASLGWAGFLAMLALFTAGGFLAGMGILQAFVQGLIFAGFAMAFFYGKAGSGFGGGSGWSGGGGGGWSGGGGGFGGGGASGRW
jgi:uncharacterized protein